METFKWRIQAYFSLKLICSFLNLIELHMASDVYALLEQKGIIVTHLRADPKTFSKIKIKHFEDLIFLMYNKSFHLRLQEINIFLYQKALNNSCISKSY